jgi:hypothetical protein
LDTIVFALSKWLRSLQPAKAQSPISTNELGNIISFRDVSEIFPIEYISGRNLYAEEEAVPFMQGSLLALAPCKRDLLADSP